MTPLTERPARLELSDFVVYVTEEGWLDEAESIRLKTLVDAVEQEAVARYKAELVEAAEDGAETVAWAHRSGRLAERAELREAVEGLHPRWRLRDGTPETWVPINAVLALLSTPEPGEPR